MSTEHANTTAATSNQNPDLDWGMGSSDSGATKVNAEQVAADALAKAKSQEPSGGGLLDHTALTGATTEGAKPEGNEGKNDGNDAGDNEGAAEASKGLAELQKRKEEALRKVAEKFEAKEFALRRKSVTMGVRKTVAFELLEKMRSGMREKINSPYMDDAEVDKLIESAFEKSIAA
jgi:hypothetical protein